MATEELVTEQFQLFGIDVSKEVLTKCVSLCHEYDVDAETFTEQWMAFNVNHSKAAGPTLENLELLEIKEFSNRAASRYNATCKETSRLSTGASLTVYGAPVSAQPDNEVLSNYTTATPKRVKLESDASIPQQNELCPATYSPNVGHSAKYASRTNPGAVVHSYGDEQLLSMLAQPASPGDVDFTITQVPNEDGELYTKAMFGFEMQHEKASTFNSHISYLSQCIMKKANITETTSVRHKTQTEVWVAGRIECDANARLNPKCVMLQGNWQESLSQAVPVDIDMMKQYSLFPGQVVVMQGVNPRGDKFIAHQVHYDATQHIPDHNVDMMNTLNGTLSIVIASGPYTTSDNLNYEPLKDLITYIGTHKPHVVIMTGPFLDSDHAKVKDNTMAETFRAFFDKLIDSIAELSTKCPLTKICIVSSIKDAFHVNVYPTPPYPARRKHTNLLMLPDPCTVSIGGVLLGLTSTDVLMHLSQEEISLGTGGDKLSRLASHVVSQQSYYPLWPAPPAHNVDAALWAAHAQLPCTPHVLVTPSNFRYFVKEVRGCVVVNPEHVSKGSGGGTFARLLLSSDTRAKNIAAQILRI